MPWPKGKKGYWTGKKRSAEDRLKMSLSRKGKPNWKKGLKLPHLSGENAPNWKGGIPNCLDCGKQLGSRKAKRCPKCSAIYKNRNVVSFTEAQKKHRLRGTKNWAEWRSAVFTRDNFTCRECGATGCYLEPHHIVPLRSNETKLFDINNGITLCRPCHQETIWKEELFAEKFLAMIS